jgi:hypothetical protein
MRSETGERYGRAAVKAIRAIKEGNCPADAWADQFKDKPQKTMAGYQNKHCPKESFLCLIDEGNVEGLDKPPRKYVDDGSLNKRYVLDALDYLREHRRDLDSMEEATLVDKLRKEGFVKDKRYNHQMHVVGALWKANLLRTS